MKWTILLINGLLQFQPDIFTPLYPLAVELERQGFRVIVDNHLRTWHGDEEPVAVVGHSCGGGSALEFQKRQHESARFVPHVFTFDAVAMPYCVHVAFKCALPGRCVNIKTALYPAIVGAENISIERVTGYAVAHVFLANNEAAKRIVLGRTAKLLRSDHENRRATRRPLPRRMLKPERPALPVLRSVR